MKTVLHLIRYVHAPQIEGLPDHLRVPSELGIRQGIVLRTHLEAEGVKRAIIFCPPLLRAQLTAGLISPGPNSPIISLQALLEPSGADKAIYEWSFAKDGGNYGYDMRNYLGDPVLACYVRFANSSIAEVEKRLAQEPKQTGVGDVHILIVGSAINLNFMAKQLCPDMSVLFNEGLGSGGRFVLTTAEVGGKTTAEHKEVLLTTL